MESLELFCEEKGYADEEIRLIKKAVDFIKNCFEGKKRLDGKSLFSYNIGVARHLVDSKMQVVIVVAGILYGVEKFVTKEELGKDFSKVVVNLVFEHSNLNKIKDKSKLVSAEVLRQIFFTELNDVRAVFVKLASKLANLETMGFLEDKNKIKYAKDAIEFYAPLAGRIGAEKLKQKITDVSFKILNPKKYDEIKKFLKETEEEREAFIKKIVKDFSNFLGNKIIKIKGRQKSIYSIYKKMTELKKPLSEQRDHFAIRIICKTKEDCYDCLGVIYENYEVVLGTLKDYILSPKENGYQSIHTCLNLDGGKILEVQIRTIEMDEFAEEGAAAHWSYKRLKTNFGLERRTSWLKEILELENSGKNEDFFKSIKLDLFGDKIYCYTPKGEVFDLPKGATVLDFAYRIHGKIGDLAVGGRINGIFSSLRKELSSGEVVEIITNKFQRPRRDWLKFVVTSRAKLFIKKGIRKYEDVKVVKSFPKYMGKDLDFEDLVFSKDFPNHRYDLARCCNPLPMDKIVGIIRSCKKILVHKKICSRIVDSLKYKVEVDWKKAFSRPIKIKIRVMERKGVLSDILNTVSRGGFVVKEANIKMIDEVYSECFLLIIPREISEVESLVFRIKKIRGMQKVWFE